ncbi:hypothetical protein EUX98_g7656 [Antrodiella citrinella]|uniref:FAD-binding FR-type domain-containing protein n=1 Tax=Antrodiella citrinella TaxID=2447956 RepID=A0A4S4MKZ0_9APHY|nr:hypothetical protein EUX98_g7656 [Antrodiella citrinella]
MSALQGWHPGEKSIQRKLGVDGATSVSYTVIEAEMPEQHREFHTTRLPFVPITTLDKDGRPWTSLAAGSSGQLGFVTSPYRTKLRMDIRLIHGDPLEENVKLFGKGKMLIAGIGIEFSSRRRNKFAGYVTDIYQKDDKLVTELEVNEAIGNCPKYINLRDLVPHPDIHPEVQYRNLHMSDTDRLPNDIIDFIHASDTVFLGSSYTPEKEDERRFPAHVGQNQRGGRQGFVRVNPVNGRTVVLPDFSGNRLMTSLGNIEATPLAALSFVSFTEGHILYLTGGARTLVGEEAQAVMPRQNVVTCLHVTGFVYIRDALTVRQRPGSEVVRSPYSPPVKLLADELQGTSAALFGNEVSVTLSKVEIYSNDLATFTWDASEPLLIQPGQTAVLDFKALLGSVQYSHMAPWNPSSINDDRIRTWTISRANTPPQKSTQFALTMREKKGGTVTGALFTIARKLASHRPELLENATPMGLTVGLVGIVGEFVMEEPVRPMLWFAGGIGITPYFAMLTALTTPSEPPSASANDKPRNIDLVVSTREPDILSSLILGSIHTPSPARIHLTVDIFTNEPFTTPPILSSSLSNVVVIFRAHHGRVSDAFVKNIQDVKEKVVYLCGPKAFERSILDALGEVGVDGSTVKREGFEY